MAKGTKLTVQVAEVTEIVVETVCRRVEVFLRTA